MPTSTRRDSVLTIELISPVLEDLSLLSQGIEELAVMGGSIGTHLAENCCVRHTRKYDLQYHFQSDRVLELCLQCHHMGMLLLLFIFIILIRYTVVMDGESVVDTSFYNAISLQARSGNSYSLEKSTQNMVILPSISQ